MSHSTGVRARAAVLAATIASAAVLLPAAPASAELTASMDNLALPSVPYSFQPQTVSGQAVLTASDTTTPLLDPTTGLQAESDGWHVTIQSSSLQYSGEYSGTDIPAANLAIAGVENPVASDGTSEDVDPVGGPKVPATSPLGTLDTPRAVLEAEPGHGTGTYTQSLTLSLTVPAGARAGTYTGIITTTISPGSTP